MLTKPTATVKAPRGTGACAFTLMEMLLALAVSAIVLAGIGGVFFSALRLRERTVALIDQSSPVFIALDVLRRDLKGALPPNGMLAGDFRSGNLSSGVGQGFGLEFSTTTGSIDDGQPWGDVQDIIYELRDPVVRTNSGKDLVRTVGRNLLSATGIEWNDHWLLGNVETLQFSCYDGVEWREAWDTSLSDTNLPTAIRVRIQFATDNTADLRNQEPLEMVFPLVTQLRTNQTQTTIGGQP
jgi:prepilin-type N-terminal cleavage/methylation domain-containing protein